MKWLTGSVITCPQDTVSDVLTHVSKVTFEGRIRQGRLGPMPGQRCGGIPAPAPAAGAAEVVRGHLFQTNDGAQRQAQVPQLDQKTVQRCLIADLSL